MPMGLTMNEKLAATRQLVLEHKLAAGKNKGGEAIMSAHASKGPSEGSSIRPTGQLSNSQRLT
jgi:hypothetical protein